MKVYKDSGRLMATKAKANPKAPDYYGSITIDISDKTQFEVQGNMYTFKINGWKRTSDTGNVYLSLAVNRYVPAGAPRAKEESFKDDIPF